MTRELPLIEAIKEAYIEEMDLDPNVFMVGQTFREGFSRIPLNWLTGSGRIALSIRQYQK